MVVLVCCLVMGENGRAASYGLRDGSTGHLDVELEVVALLLLHDATGHQEVKLDVTVNCFLLHDAEEQAVKLHAWKAAPANKHNGRSGAERRGGEQGAAMVQ